MYSVWRKEQTGGRELLMAGGVRETGSRKLFHLLFGYFKKYINSRILSNLFYFCIVPRFPNLRALKTCMSDHFTWILIISTSNLSMAFMINHTSWLQPSTQGCLCFISCLPHWPHLLPLPLCHPHCPGTLMVSHLPLCPRWSLRPSLSPSSGFSRAAPLGSLPRMLTL